MTAGRKRSFDKQEALEKAMRLFWQSGYSGTSLSDLTTELGINKPSLYAAFGNKEALFKASVEHYMACYGAPHWTKLLEPSDASLEERLKRFLHAIVDLVSDPSLPQGCLVVKSTCESGSQAIPDEITMTLNNIERENKKALVVLFGREKAIGNLPKGSDVNQLATYLLAVLYGIGVLAKNGNAKHSLRAVADVSVQALVG
ncbi:MAG: TetR/AcrR family transcriptional regulator [Candidatus Thiodiazotropha sp. (ex Codakia rugifera)]|nr:TetR/AcrR family transcriptional regulator [Candidatus Thiodiazotropha sp. (ex Codakia rugifera)]